MRATSPHRRARAVVVTVLGLVLTAPTAITNAAPAEPQAISMATAIVAAAGTAGGPAGLHPVDIVDAYALSGGITGGTVGVVIPFDTPALESDLATYRSAFGLPACTTANGCFMKVDQDGGTAYPSVDAEWSMEASLDVQAVSAACPACRILVVETADAGMFSLGTGVNTAVALGGQAVSMSWGMRENIDATYFSSHYFTHAGVPMLAATGDSGYPQATMPATLPNVIAVGGTTLSRTGASGAARLDTAGEGIVVANGRAIRAAGTSPVQQHAATLARARSDLTRAQAKAAIAASAVTTAARAVAAQQRLLGAAAAKVRTAARRVKASPSAASTRTLAAARKVVAERTRTVRTAKALVTARTRALTTANTSVRACTAAVQHAQAVVTADQRGTTSILPPAVSAPVPSPVVTTPSQPWTPPAPPSAAPVVPIEPAPVVTTDPAPEQTPEPAPDMTPTPTPQPVQTLQPVRTNTGPTAGFAYTRTGLSVAFDATGSSDPDGTVAGYAWDFGDGSTGTGRTLTHVFSGAGSYPVSLTVTDDEGATTTASATVSVAAPAPPAAPSAARGGWVETAWSGGGSGCSTYIDKPAWQTDTACSTRTVADVSAVGDFTTGLAVYDSAAVAQGWTSDGWMVVGGTSLSTPLLAGMLVRSGHAANYSDAGPLYANRSAFWDVTSGSNGSCGGSPVCTAGAGYDAPTGVGTPKSLASF